MIVPDKITPELGWRVWRVADKTGQLRPVHIHAAPNWQSHRPEVASCYTERPESRAWVPVTIEEALETGEITHVDWFRRRSMRENIDRPPRTRLPRGMFFVWRTVDDPHHAPEPECTCGLYATKNVEQCADQLMHGTVIGRVNLWGKVIPGEKGYRAEFAYPSELWVVTGEQRYTPRQVGLSLTFSFQLIDPYAMSETTYNEKSALKIAERLVESYGVPVHVTDDWQALRS